MKKNKIGIFAFKLAVGNELYLSSLAKYLRRMASVYKFGDGSAYLPNGIRVANGGGPLQMFLNTVSILNVVKIFVILSRVNFNAIFLITSHPLNIVTAVIAKLKGVRVVSHIHDPLPHSGCKYGWIIYISQYLQVFLSDHVVVSGDNLRMQLEDKYVVTKDKISVLPFGAHRSEVVNFEKRKRFRFSILGRIEDYKGVDVFLEAARIFVEKYPSSDVVFTIAGAGSVGKYLAQIGSIPSQNVQLVNEKISDSDFDLYCRESIAVVLPYKDATQTGTTQISFREGTPVIVADVGALPEDVKMSGGGVVIADCDSKKLAETFFCFYSNPEHVEHMGAQGFQYYRENLLWSKLADKYYKVIIG